MRKMSQKIWYSIIKFETECLEISMRIKISVQNFLGVMTGLLGVFEDTIKILIADRIDSESGVTLGQ